MTFEISAINRQKKHMFFRRSYTFKLFAMFDKIAYEDSEVPLTPIPKKWPGGILVGVLLS